MAFRENDERSETFAGYFCFLIEQVPLPNRISMHHAFLLLLLQNVLHVDTTVCTCGCIHAAGMLRKKDIPVCLTYMHFTLPPKPPTVHRHLYNQGNRRLSPTRPTRLDPRPSCPCAPRMDHPLIPWRHCSGLVESGFGQRRVSRLRSLPLLDMQLQDIQYKPHI